MSYLLVRAVFANLNFSFLESFQVEVILLMVTVATILETVRFVILNITFDLDPLPSSDKMQHF
jgi:hypothetical protein